MVCVVGLRHDQHFILEIRVQVRGLLLKVQYIFKIMSEKRENTERNYFNKLLGAHST